MNSSRKFVSVIIPNYNHSKFLQKRIDSVLNQTYQNFELIILDDCSTDNSKDVIEQFRNHPKVSKIIYNEENSGSTFKQWKKGIQLAKGEYIWIAESDDYASPLFLEKMLGFMEGNLTLGFVHCDGIEVDENDKPTGWQFSTFNNGEFWTKKWSSSHVEKGKIEANRYLSKQCTVVNVSGVLFRKSAMMELDLPDVTFKYAADWLSYFKLALHHDVGFLSEILNFYRGHPNNASKIGASNNVLFEEKMRVYKEIRDNCVFDLAEKRRFLTHVREFLKSAENIDSVKKNEYLKLYPIAKVEFLWFLNKLIQKTLKILKSMKYV